MVSLRTFRAAETGLHLMVQPRTLQGKPPTSFAIDISSMQRLPVVCNMRVLLGEAANRIMLPQIMYLKMGQAISIRRI
jgi:hypothetical protein